jgi:hypothetical protein
MGIRIGGVFLADDNLLTKDEIEPKDIFWLYAIAIERKTWIEAISLGYTAIEIGLTKLIRSGVQGHPTISESRIEKCNYLIQLAKLAQDEKIIDQSLYDKIDQFNQVRRAAIHKLAEGRTKKSELESAAHSVTDCLSEIQRLFGFKITWGPEERNPDFKE